MIFFCYFILFVDEVDDLSKDWLNFIAEDDINC